MDLKGSYVCLCVTGTNRQGKKEKKQTRKREDGRRFMVWFAHVTVWQAKVCVCMAVMSVQTQPVSATYRAIQGRSMK